MSRQAIKYNQSTTWGVEGLKLEQNFIELYGSSNVSTAVYGANMARFLKKLKDYQSGRVNAECPSIVVLGDSIVASPYWPLGWFGSYLSTKFGFDQSKLNIYGYGGNSIVDILPFCETALIYPNPDLIIFCEFENAGTDDSYLYHIENLIQLIRERTSADIAISTWGFHRADLEAYIASPDSGTNGEYELFNWYRDISKTYNCELIDINKAFINYAQSGYNLDIIYGDGTHPSQSGYDLIYTPEFIKHFNTIHWTENANITYPLAYKEELIYLMNQFIFPAFNKNICIFTGAWAISGCKINSSQLNDTIVIDAKNSIGFDLSYFNTIGNLKIEISLDGGSTYINPSAITFNNKPLQYATPVHMSTKGLYAVKHVDIISNILNNGILESGLYYLKITDISGSDYTISVIDDSTNILGSFIWSKTNLETSTIGIYQIYNQVVNYYSTTVNFVLNDASNFKVKSNWINEVDLSTNNHAKVFGFARGDYKIKLTLSSGQCSLSALKIIH